MWSNMKMLSMVDLPFLNPGCRSIKIPFSSTSFSNLFLTSSAYSLYAEHSSDIPLQFPGTILSPFLYIGTLILLYNTLLPFLRDFSFLPYFFYQLFQFSFHSSTCGSPCFHRYFIHPTCLLYLHSMYRFINFLIL